MNRFQVQLTTGDMMVFENKKELKEVLEGCSAGAFATLNDGMAVNIRHIVFVRQLTE